MWHTWTILQQWSGCKLNDCNVMNSVNFAPVIEGKRTRTLYIAIKLDKMKLVRSSHRLVLFPEALRILRVTSQLVNSFLNPISRLQSFAKSLEISTRFTVEYRGQSRRRFPHFTKPRNGRRMCLSYERARKRESRNFINYCIYRSLSTPNSGCPATSNAIENFITFQLAHLLQAYEFPAKRSNTEIELKPRHGEPLPAFSLHFYNAELDAHRENTRCESVSPLRWSRCSSETIKSHLWLFHAVDFGAVRIWWPGTQRTFRRSQFRMLPSGCVTFSRATRADRNDSEFFLQKELIFHFRATEREESINELSDLSQKRKSRISSEKFFRCSFDVRHIRDSKYSRLTDFICRWLSSYSLMITWQRIVLQMNKTIFQQDYIPDIEDLRVST